MAEQVEIRVMRDDRRPLYVGCASGNHKWVVGSRGSELCGRCGLIAGSVQKPKRPRPPKSERPVPPVPKANRDERRAAKVRYLFERDGPGCFYCHCELAVEDVVLDHYIPKHAGGADGLSNRRASCKRCDRAKGGRIPWDAYDIEEPV